MSKLISITEAAEFLATHDKYTVLTHAHPDGDTLGSGFALVSALRSLGKKAKIVMQTYNQTVERFLEKYGDVYKDVIISKAHANEYITNETLLFIVDTQKTSMVEEPALIDVTKNIIVIDHHGDND